MPWSLLLGYRQEPVRGCQKLMAAACAPAHTELFSAGRGRGTVAVVQKSKSSPTVSHSQLLRGCARAPNSPGSPTMACHEFTAGQWALTRLAHRIAPSLRRTDRGRESGLEWERLVSDEKPASPSTHPCMTSSMPTG